MTYAAHIRGLHYISIGQHWVTDWRPEPSGNPDKQSLLPDSRLREAKVDFQTTPAASRSSTRQSQKAQATHKSPRVSVHLQLTPHLLEIRSLLGKGDDSSLAFSAFPTQPPGEGPAVWLQEELVPGGHFTTHAALALAYANSRASQRKEGKRDTEREMQMRIVSRGFTLRGSDCILETDTQMSHSLPTETG